jgi:hypothetical protein
LSSTPLDQHRRRAKRELLLRGIHHGEPADRGEAQEAVRQLGATWIRAAGTFLGDHAFGLSQRERGEGVGLPLRHAPQFTQAEAEQAVVAAAPKIAGVVFDDL